MSMKRTLLILAVLCVYTFAMVPKHRITREAEKEICAPQTPCSWGVYSGQSKLVYMTVDNSYCKCESSKKCIQDEDDQVALAFVYKCKTVKT